MMLIKLLCQYRCSTRMLCVLSSVSVSVCGLGTSTKSHKIYEFGWNTTKCNEKFTYRHWNCCWLLFYQLDSAVYWVVWPFYRTHFRISWACRRRTYLHRNKWRAGLLIAFTSYHCKSCDASLILLWL